MIMAAIALLGWFSWQRLPTTLFPHLSRPTLHISVQAGEKPPEEIEKQIVEPMEGRVMKMKDISKVVSRCETGKATLTVSYEWGTDMEQAYYDLQTALSDVTSNKDVSKLQVIKYNPNADPIMELALRSNYDNDWATLGYVATEQLYHQLVQIEGIADVAISGKRDRTVLVHVSSVLLQSMGLSPSSIQAAIKQFDAIPAGGTVEDNGYRYVVSGVSAIRSIEDIGKVIVSSPPANSETDNQEASQAITRLQDVARIEWGLKDAESIVKVNGTPCLGLSIYKESNFSNIDAVQNVRKRLRELATAMPNYRLEEIDNQGDFIGLAINDFKRSAFWGVFLAIAVLWLFLRRAGLTIMVSVAIPLSIIATFNLMYFGKLTINIMTLGGLALGAGMLVDNAIVVIESIVRQLNRQTDREEAIIEGTASVGRAIVASTLTTIVVFLPIVFLSGPSGEMFKEQALTVTFSLVSSLFVALCVIPTLAFQWLKTKKYRTGILFVGYPQWLSKLLPKAPYIIVVTLFLITGGLYLFRQLGSEFLPESASKNIQISIKTEHGSTLQFTQRVMDNITEFILRQYPEMRIYSHCGLKTSLNAPDKGQKFNQGTLTLLLQDSIPVHPDSLVKQMTQYFSGIPHLEIEVMREQGVLQDLIGEDNDAAIILNVRGEDVETLDRLTARISQEVATVEGVAHVRATTDKGNPILEWKVKQNRVGRLGISTEAIAHAIRSKLREIEAGTLKEERRQYPILIKEQKKLHGKAFDMPISINKQTYQLSDLAELRQTYAPQELLRENQQRTGQIAIELRKGTVLSEATTRLQKKLEASLLPAGYTYEFGGEEKQRKEANSSLLFALLFSIILVYMVLAGQFESFIMPFIIIFAIPLAIAGTALFFFLTGRSLDVMAFIGIVLLGGIAVNNAIILLDAMNRYHRAGTPLKEAVLRAANERIRPTIMTSLTTIFSLLPMVFPFGEGAAFRSTMAWAVISGLFSSTLLILIVIPALYYQISKWKP